MMRSLDGAKSIKLLPLIVFFTLSLMTTIYAEPLDNWHLRNPLPTPNNLYSVCYGNDRFVAVGLYGAIVTSMDGVYWTALSSGTRARLKSVAYANSLFVAVGESGTILTSPDGINWTSRSSGTTEWINGITYGDNNWVAVGGSTVLTSTDAVVWERQIAGLPAYLENINYVKDTFVAVGRLGAILTSVNGLSWASRVSGTQDQLNGVIYANDTFVAVGSSGIVVTSSDAVTWSAHSSHQTNWMLNAIAYGSEAFVAVGWYGTIRTSSDGTVWTSQTSNTTAALFGIAHGNNTFVAVGEAGVIMTSTDGIAWTPRMSVTQKWLLDVTFGQNLFAAVGTWGTLLTSTDGTTWNSRTAGTTDFLSKIAYGNNAFVALAENDKKTVLISTDGLSWASHTAGTEDQLVNIVYGNNRFVAVGYNAIVTSTDGITWTPQSSAGSYLNGIAYGNNIFVAIGSYGCILTSADGTTWTSQTTGATHSLHNITYGNNKFIISAGSGIVLTSADGVDWIARSTGIAGDVNAVTYGEGVFVAVGEGGDIFTSTHGLIWTHRDSGITQSLRGVAYGNGTFVTVGINGIIVQSDPLENNEASDATKIESLHLAAETYIAGKDLTGLMNLYSDTYLDGGNTKSILQGKYASVFDAYTDVGVTYHLTDLTILEDTAELTELTEWHGKHKTTGEIHTRYKSKTATLKKVGTEWRFYGNQEKYGVDANLHHLEWSGEYLTSIRIVDPDRSITSVSIAGPGISVPLDISSLEYDNGTMSWHTKNMIKIDDMSSNLPILPLTYAITIGDAQGSYQTTAVVTGDESSDSLLLYTAGYLAPNNIVVKKDLTFRWAAETGYNKFCYIVALYRGVGSSPKTPPQGHPLWTSVSVDGSHVKYDGLPLPEGMYTFVVQTIDPQGNTSSSNAVSFMVSVETANDPLDTWHILTTLTLPNYQYLRAIAYGNNVFVAVGDKGNILISEDGITWTSQTLGTTDDLLAVAYGNHTFVAVGNEYIYSSSDCINWVSRDSGTTSWLNGVKYVNGLFVALGASGTLVASRDGVTWTPRPTGTTAYLYDIAYGKNTFVAVGGSTILTSTDGMSWTPQSLESLFLKSIAYGNSRFITVGEYGAILTSMDGMSWTPSSTGAYGQDITEEALRSVQSIEIIYVKPEIPPPYWLQNWFNDITFCCNTFLATTTQGYLLTSSDGRIWTYRRPGTAGSILSITYGNDTFVALSGSGTIMQSNPLGECFLKGDMDGNEMVDLRDLIIALKIISGEAVPACNQSYSSSGTDVDGGNQVGLTEAVYISQIIAGVRSMQ